MWQHLTSRLFGRISATANFCRDLSGNIAVSFAIALVPIVMAAGGAVDFSRANSARTNMQGALDSTALALVSTAANQTQDVLSANATSYFNAIYASSGVSNVQVSAQYDSNSAVLTLNASGVTQTSIMQ